MAHFDVSGMAARMAHVGTIMVVGALPASLINFRGSLLRALVAAGYQVIALADRPDAVVEAQLRAIGVEYRWYHVQRNRLSPTSDLQSLVQLRGHFLGIRPDVVLAYTIKPVLWSAFALRGVHGVRFCALITGLGYAFQGASLARRTLTRVVRILYKHALRRADITIFQNGDNRDAFVDLGLVVRDRTAVVSGSGVDLEYFPVAPLSPLAPVVLTVARLLGDKGLREFVDAAQSIRLTRPDVRFQLLGPMDPSPDGISPDELAKWVESGAIEYLGETHDVRPFLAACHLFVLASYHEGMPRTALEALASGRPVVTTDVPGCRDTIHEGRNGRLVPPRDAKALAVAIADLLGRRSDWPAMGAASREWARHRFDVRLVNRAMFEHLGIPAV